MTKELRSHTARLIKENFDLKALIASIGVPHTPCEWKEDTDGNWDVACGPLHYIQDGTPKENNMNFCCYCGGKLTQVLYREDK